MENKPDILETVVRAGLEPKRKGRSWWVSCPFHHDRTPSMKIDPERQTFFCFGCETKGDVVTFIERLHGLSFKETLAYLGIKGGGRPISINPKQQIKRDELKAFRKWEREYLIEITDYYRDFHIMAKDFKTMEEAEEWAEGFHLMPIIEWHMDILSHGTDEEKYQLYVQFKENHNV